MTKDSLVPLAKLVAAHLRGDIIPAAKNAFCTIGFPKCRCDTCVRAHNGKKNTGRKGGDTT